MSNIIGILSGKGGVGKTTVVSNLGAALSSDFRKSVVVLDANIGTSHLGLHMGIYQDLPVTLKDVMNRNVPVSNATYVHPSGLRVIPAPISGDGVKMKPSKLAKVTKTLSRDYELVVIDCPPGLGRDVLTALSAVDSGIIVTNPDFPSVADALKTAQLMRKMKKEIVGIVVNKSRGEKYELTSREIETTCGAKVLAVIPDDSAVPKSISQGSPVVSFDPGSRVSQSFKRLAGDMIGMPYESPSILGRIMSIFSRNAAPARQEPIERAAVPQIEVGRAKTVDEGEKMEELEDVAKLKRQIREELKMKILKKVRERMEES